VATDVVDHRVGRGVVLAIGVRGVRHVRTLLRLAGRQFRIGPVVTHGSGDDDRSAVVSDKELDMSMYGANPEQLSHLGTTLTRQIDTITQLMTTVDGVINSTTWQGPARERFVGDWNGSFKSALAKLNEAFGAAGRDCGLRADELRRVMGT
jgi:uncharacterized protein YukE